MKNKILIFLFAVSLTGCQKEPNASFTTSKEAYTAGETIELKNTSENGESFQWIMPDGKVLTSTDVSFKTDANLANNTTLTFTLKAFSKNGNAMAVAVKTINIEAGNGSVIFWQMQGVSDNITEVTFGSHKNFITRKVYSQPACGAAGSATFEDLAPGTYNYKAKDGTLSWSGEFTVKSGECTPVQLGF